MYVCKQRRSFLQKYPVYILIHGDLLLRVLQVNRTCLQMKHFFCRQKTHLGVMSSSAGQVMNQHRFCRHDRSISMMLNQIHFSLFLSLTHCIKVKNRIKQEHDPCTNTNLCIRSSEILHEEVFILESRLGSKSCTGRLDSQNNILLITTTSAIRRFASPG